MSEYSLGSFLTACGAGSPLHLAIEHRDSREAIYRVLPQPFAVIGSGPRADIWLGHESVSRRHAYLQVVDGRLFYVDLGSRCGIAQNGRGERSGWLEPDAPIQIGPFEVRLLEGSQPGPANDFRPATVANPLSTRSAEEGTLPGVTLEFRNKRKEYPSWSMDRVLTLLGRSSDCKVRLKSASVSRVHCGLFRSPQGVWAVDLLGRGGITVNGRTARFARLVDGDELLVGDFLIGLRCEQILGPPARLGDRSMVPAPRAGRFGAPIPVSARRPPGPEVVGPPAVQGSLEPEVMGTSLAPLFEQFGQMQQQMFDQFQQVMVTMFQMFTTMHRDQMGLLRDELDGLRQLTQELHDLKAEQVAHRTLSPDQTVNRAIGTAPSASSSVIGAAGPDPAPWPAVRLPPAGDAKRPEGPRLPPAPGGSSAQSGEEIHVLLTRRIAAIQQEQQSRWQKVLGLVMGSAQGGLSP